MFEEFRSPIDGPLAYPLWTPAFPGVSNESPFGVDFLFSEDWYESISTSEMDELRKITRDWETIAHSVDIFVRHLTNLKEIEGGPDVVICAPPRAMMEACAAAQERIWRGQSERKPGPKRTTVWHVPTSDQQSLLDFVPEVEQTYQEFLQRQTAENFHHLLKAKAMSLKKPTQLILPATLAKHLGLEKGRLQDKATVAWNLCVAILYKSDMRLWRLERIPAGTCYIGISFYREKRTLGGKIGVTLAQVFTPEGEGLVLRGERFEWPRGTMPHLTEGSARRLIENALSSYERFTHQKPSRVVVHKTSLSDEAELKGFKSALPSEAKYDFLTIEERAQKIRFFRKGAQPVLRGTAIDLPNRTWLLYTKAFIPFMRLYPGPRIPRPLEILQHDGDTPIEIILQEILALCKLNWNSADFTSVLPITLEFARSVGKVMREIPVGVTPETRYLYYM